MVVNMRDTGTTANSTETEFTDKPTELNAVDAGKKENVCSGTTSRRSIARMPELKIIDNNLRTLKSHKILSFSPSLTFEN